jgi:acetyl coenzyme A synthetase (ADP forming)-like protein
MSRETPSPLASLDPLLRPRVVAVVGASRRPGTIGYELFRNVVASGFTGVVYPVNASGEPIQAVRSYRSVCDVPEEVDLAVLAVPAAGVLAVVDDCAAAGVKALVVVSAGFKEVGGAGAALEAELTRRVRAAGMRMVGPNCLGLVNLDPQVRLNATFSPALSPPGSVAFLSQSGALGVAILDYSRDLGLGLSSFVSIGNKADVSSNDLLEYWERDPLTDVVLMYLESFGNPRKFSAIARRLARVKPIVAVKSGRSKTGGRAASSHTGALAGVDTAVDALFAQAGVIRTDTIEDLFNTAMVLANQPLPRGPRVAILTNAGGPGILAADACEHRGLELPDLSPQVEAALRAHLPAEASARNPVDTTAGTPAAAYGEAARLMLADPAVDALIAIFVPPLVTSVDDIADQLSVVAGVGEKPVVACFMGAHGVLSGRESLRQHRIPSFAFPEAAVQALARIVRYAEWRREPESEVPALDGIDRVRARDLVAAWLPGPAAAGPAEARWLPPQVCAELLACYGIATAPSQLARSADEAVAAADALGYPVAVKLVSETLTHKADVGGVRLGLAGPGAVRDAYYAIEGALRSAGHLDAFAGALVQRMVPDGVEVIVGGTVDPALGPLLMFGLGGTYVELLEDVAFRLHPLTRRDAAEMVRSIRTFALLTGYRGQPAADVAAIEDTLLRLSQLLTDVPELVELDVNPLKVRAPGRGAIAVDARMRVGQPTG